MKRISAISILVILLFVSCVSMEQGFVTDEMRSYAEVVESPGLSQNAIYVAANSWMTTVFKNAHSVIDYADKGEGKIVGSFDKYVLSGPVGLSNTRLRTSMTIEAKDGRYRILFTNPTWQWVDTSGGETAPKLIAREDWIMSMRDGWINLAESLKDYVAKYKESSNW